MAQKKQTGKTWCIVKLAEKIKRQKNLEENKMSETNFVNVSRSNLTNGQKRIEISFLNAPASGQSQPLTLTMKQVNRTTGVEQTPETVRIDNSTYAKLMLKLHDDLLPKYARITSATLEFVSDDATSSQIKVKPLILQADGTFELGKEIDEVASYYDDVLLDQFSYFNVTKTLSQSNNGEHYFAIGKDDAITGYLELPTADNSLNYLRPKLVIDYLPYDEFGKDRAKVNGSIGAYDTYSVDLLSGKLEATKFLAKTTGEKMQASLGMTYMPTDCQSTMVNGYETGLPKGWKYNAMQYLFQDGENYKYIDASGREHIFKPSSESGLYYDTSGTGFVLKTGTINHEITDEKTTTLIFGSNKLCEIRKKTRKTPERTVSQIISNDSLGRLTRYLDGDLGDVKINYEINGDVTIADDTYDYNSATNNVVVIKKDSSGYLSEILTQEGTWEYSVDSEGKLTSIKNINGEAVVFEYETDGKVKNIQKTFTDENLTTTVLEIKEFVYGALETLVKTTTYPNSHEDRKGVTYSYLFNEEGKTITNYELNHKNESIMGSVILRENGDFEKFQRKIDATPIGSITFGGQNSVVVNGDNYINDDYLTEVNSDILSLRKDVNLEEQDFIFSCEVEMLKGAHTRHTSNYGVELLTQSGTRLCQVVVNPTIQQKQFLSAKFTITSDVDVKVRAYTRDKAVKMQVSNVKITNVEKAHSYSCIKLSTGEENLLLTDGVEQWYKLVPLNVKINGEQVSSKVTLTENDLRKNAELALSSSTHNFWYNNLTSFIPNVTNVKLVGNGTEISLLNCWAGNFVQRQTDKVLNYLVFDDEEYENNVSIRFKDGERFYHVSFKDEVGNYLGTSANNVYHKFTYNDYGKAITEQYYDDAGDYFTDKIETNTEYSTDKTQVQKIKEYLDTFVLETSYEYNTDGTLSKTTYPNGRQETYSYDKKKMVEISSAGASNELTYDKENLTSVSSNGATYSYEYDSSNRISKIKLGTATLISFEYSYGNIYDEIIATYANGNKKKVTLDLYGRVLQVETCASGEEFEIIKQFFYCEESANSISTYDDVFDSGITVFSDSKLKKSVDKGVVSLYTYSEDDLISTETRGNQSYTSSLNSVGELIREEINFDTSTTTNKMIHTIEYELNNAVDGDYYSTDEVTHLNSTFTESHARDGLDRTKQVIRELDSIALKDETTYNDVYDSDDEACGTTVFPSNHKYSIHTANGSAYQRILTESFDYNANGDISAIVKNFANYNSTGSSATKSVRYFYDNLSRLIREDNQELGFSKTYEYDNNGNLTTKKVYGYTTGSLPSSPLQTFNYSYDLSTDRLLSYNGKTCSYDSNGNPTNYLGNVTVFDKENKLCSFKKQGEANATTFTYDAEGLRKTKTTASGVTKTFTYLNGTLYREQFSQGGSSYDLRFIYTASGITGVIINGAKYLYLKNNFGDVTEIYDANGNLICRYVYDAWGNHKVLNPNGTENTSASFIGNINPIRYRRYYYDADLGLYYLKSRYYDSEVGRFISIDKLDYLDPETINGLNLYAYCLNNPIANIDPNGTFWNSIKKTISWLSNNIGFFSKSFQVIDKNSNDNIFFGTETGVAVEEKSGDDSKPFSVYTQSGNEWYKFWEYQVGFKIKIGDFSYSLSTGLGESNYSFAYKETAIDIKTGIDKSGIKISHTKDKINNYVEYYIRTIPTVAAIVLTYFIKIPVIKLGYLIARVAI